MTTSSPGGVARGIADAQKRYALSIVHSTVATPDLATEVAAFAQAARWLADLPAAIPSSDWEEPWSGEWSVRTIVGHTSFAIARTEAYLALPAETEELDSAEAYFESANRRPVDPDFAYRRGVGAGIALGDSPAEVFKTNALHAAAFAEQQTEQLITTVAGTIRLSAFVATRTFEAVVHGLDIAAISRQQAQPPQVPLRRALELATSLSIRAGNGPSVLFALTGRGALPASYSILP